jgi:hypothetical protein
MSMLRLEVMAQYLHRLNSTLSHSEYAYLAKISRMFEIYTDLSLPVLSHHLADHLWVQISTVQRADAEHGPVGTTQQGGESLTVPAGFPA